ncbi:hypothetical protein [Mucilaginibacter ginkgonis]|uniref:Uncharacterized protein n=1 Tax=Mucilaginibacter ginkgonis TaxID=2682091 RepID=A0A6I4HXC7_9SPHI|nr:hypothetical protein [Mucilaginibacter ginkgonis]QQL51002.1 hypothetical protein GO620_006005 [Mucilaginibacter ginkgonis]
MNGTPQLPNISLNKLGEFQNATPAKKRSILKSIKFPSTFKNARYSSPKSAFTNFMADKHHDYSIFETKKNLIAKRVADTSWKINNKVCCMEAVDHLKTISETTVVPYLTFKSQKGLQKEFSNINIDGVEINLNPDIVLLDNRDLSIKGVVKLVFSKSREVDFTEGQMISGLLKYHIDKHYGLNIDPVNCMSIDVFHDKHALAPVHFDEQYKKIKMSCKEILELWPSISA